MNTISVTPITGDTSPHISTIADRSARNLLGLFAPYHMKYGESMDYYNKRIFEGARLLVALGLEDAQLFGNQGIGFLWDVNNARVFTYVEDGRAQMFPLNWDSDRMKEIIRSSPTYALLFGPE